MIDIRLIRDNPERVRKGLKDRGGKTITEFEKVLEKDKEWRAILKFAKWRETL